MMGFVPFAQKRAAVNFRKVVRPVPETLPACRNCSAFRCDHDDRMGFGGQVLLRRTNLRCSDQGFSVSLDMVCDRHQYRHTDRRDV